MRTVLLLALFLVPSGFLTAQSRTLDIYWIDVEGGAATLIVSPRLGLGPRVPRAVGRAPVEREESPRSCPAAMPEAPRAAAIRSSAADVSGFFRAALLIALPSSQSPTRRCRPR